MRPVFISVIGTGDTATDRDRMFAEEVGRLLAERGAIVVCGGLNGVMEAACKGAKSAGGLTVGLLPGTEPADANPWVDIPIPTGLGYARNSIVVKAGQAVIAIGGAFGTLSEIGHAIADGKTVVGIETWELARKGNPDSHIVRASGPADAVEKALQAVKNGTSRSGS
ncbi:MAG: TIGR00725 family protein [Dehalococcoidia bacterium]|nr:TIGR00725 family protein [Dehalococcoidia bacterium]MSQ34387.1 TIGR00725 family protein [Dehalococcoidia bacterium]